MKNLHVISWQEGDFWIAKCLENSVASQGYSPEEAKKNLLEALELTFEEETSLDFPQILNLRSEELAFA